ncbi:RHS repeat-associated core domain-containing protein [Oscillospiraceae bacterium OttesenSCG-928-F05]|nr:RHS repeat-associated core domain-containing protein [Oscillospiraceae bacterium OttesenSCG-928-F05]
MLASYDYDAFGNEKAPDVGDVNPFRYCGEYFDFETGRIYLRARYYDPVVGRFVSEDPARDGRNWYVYCGNSPIMFIDPSGKTIELDYDILNSTDLAIMLSLTTLYNSTDDINIRGSIHKTAESIRQRAEYAAAYSARGHVDKYDFSNITREYNVEVITSSKMHEIGCGTGVLGTQAIVDSYSGAATANELNNLISILGYAVGGMPTTLNEFGKDYLEGELISNILYYTLTNTEVRIDDIAATIMIQNPYGATNHTFLYHYSSRRTGERTFTMYQYRSLGASLDGTGRGNSAVDDWRRRGLKWED